MLLSTGEGVSIALLAMALQAPCGCKAVSMNAMQVGIITEKRPFKSFSSRILEIKTEKNQARLS